MVRKAATSGILKSLRKLMREATLSAYIVPSCDAHNSEYLAARDERMAYLTGFTGSFGTAVVKVNGEACLWTDGRYYLQAEEEMDDNWTLMKEYAPGTPSRSEWLIDNLESGSSVGVDPFLMPIFQFSEMKVALEKAGLSLVGLEKNLIDAIWSSDRPPYPENPIFVQDLKFCGRRWEDKVSEVRSAMAKRSADVLVISALDEVAWLLNLRGSDIPYNPVFFAYLAIAMDRIFLFVNEEQIKDTIKSHLAPQESVNNVVEYRPYLAITEFLTSAAKKGLHIWLSKKASQGLYMASHGGETTVEDGHLSPNNKMIPRMQNKPTVTVELTPVALMKAVKNETEIRGFINCHIRDGAAMCCFLSWVEAEVAKGTVTEVTAAQKLLDFRQKMQDFMGPSFATISASGPNGSHIHYKPSPETDRGLNVDEMYLVDSGGQYKDGTTDVTRTVHFGTATEFQKECFTRVLQGHIRLATTVFPEKVKGSSLDSIARTALWKVGLDYAHGTGHGVGSYLNVHEGPMGISWKPNPDDPGLLEGMVLSNEPGYYSDNNFGIRVENLVHIVNAPMVRNSESNMDEGKGKKFLTFEDLTLVPIQLKMILPNILSAEEVEYLNSYHLKCRDMVIPLLREMGNVDALNWLIKETKPMG